MKKIVITVNFILFIVTIISAQNKAAVAESANTSLSNLYGTKVNVTLLPDQDNLRNLGNSVRTWRNLYLDSGIYFGGQKFLSLSIPKNNTVIGISALKRLSQASDNTAIGYRALESNTTGYQNTIVGSLSLKKNTTGFGNCAIGYKNLDSNTTGLVNTAIGYLTLQWNTTGSGNVAIGDNALRASNGSDNIAIGYALSNHKTGDYNIAFGDQAMLWHESGSYNIGIGYGSVSCNKSSNNIGIGELALGNSGSISNIIAIGTESLIDLSSDSKGACTAVGEHTGMNNTTGSYNTYFGYHAGNTVETGNNNTTIGYGADISDGSFSNATALGNFAIATASNKVRIGNGSVTSIGGAVGWTNFSDERIKTNIKQNVPGLAFINLLKPVTYNFDLTKEEQLFKRKDSAEGKEKYDVQKIKFTGFLAQQVEAAAKKINYDFSGVDAPSNDKDVYGLRYGDFVVPLVKAVQELSKMNDTLNLKISQFENLKMENETLKSQLKNLESEIENIKAMIGSGLSSVNSQRSTLSPALLQQNVPNPFSNSTTINYSLPQHFSSAKIIVSDVKGNTLKQINLSNYNGSVNIDAAILSSGAYQYSLIVDGKLIDTKQMILSK